MTKETEKKVDLYEPLQIEGQDEIKTITLRKPFAGELRGLSFAEVINMNFDAMMILIPRISNISERDMLNLDSVNYAPLFMEVAGFFVNIDSQTE